MLDNRRIQSNNIPALDTKGFILYYLERYHKPLDFLDQLLKIDDSDPEALYLRCQPFKSRVQNKNGKQRKTLIVHSGY